MIAGAYLIIINLITFAVFGYDKSQARKDAWRVPEKTLFLLAALGGSIGAIAGMYYFHHKTKHTTFRLGMPAILLLQILLLSQLGTGYFSFSSVPN